MSRILLAVAALVAVTAVVLAMLAWRARRRAEAATAEEHARLDEAQRTIAHLETRTGTLRAELAEQHQSNAELTARLRHATATGGRAPGLWALEQLRQARAADTPLLMAAPGPGVDVAAELRAALALELELLREEVGTHAELGEVALGSPIDAREALTTFRVVQEVAAALAKRADGLRVTVGRDGRDAVITVEAEGYGDGSAAHAGLEHGLAALEATVAFEPGPDGLVAVVRIPAA